MPGILNLNGAMLALVLSMAPLTPALAEANKPKQTPDAINNLQAPLYTPFVERYVLDELKQLRTDIASQRVELTQQILDREHSAVDRAVSYATNTVTYFFYLIAAASSILVLVGWTSVREMRERVMAQARKSAPPTKLKFTMKSSSCAATMWRH